MELCLDKNALLRKILIFGPTSRSTPTSRPPKMLWCVTEQTMVKNQKRFWSKRIENSFLAIDWVLGEGELPSHSRAYTSIYVWCFRMRQMGQRFKCVNDLPLQLFYKYQKIIRDAQKSWICQTNGCCSRRCGCWRYGFKDSNWIELLAFKMAGRGCFSRAGAYLNSHVNESDRRTSQNWLRNPTCESF